MSRLLREPLLHFLVLGVALFGLYGLIGDREAEQPQEIVVAAAQVANLREAFARTWQRPPTPDELSGLIENHIREEITYREALALGLDRDDTVIRRRLRQKMEFFAEDLAASEPTDAELADYLAAHPEPFRTRDRVSFRHVFLSARREGSLEADTQDVALRLARMETAGETPLGDAFLLGDSFSEISRDEVARTLGDGFAGELFALETGGWRGPIASAYGLHFVFIDARTLGAVPSLDAVRPAVEREWENARRNETLEAFYGALRARYEIIVEPPGQAGGAVR